MADVFAIQDLKHCSRRTKQALADHGITDLVQIAQAMRPDGGSPAYELRYRVPSFGEKALFELFDSIFWTLIEQADKTTDAGGHRDHEAALALVRTLIRGTTGDIGGRDQARLFAEIAFDMVEAVRLEGQKRLEALQ